MKSLLNVLVVFLFIVVSLFIATQAVAQSPFVIVPSGASNPVISGNTTIWQSANSYTSIYGENLSTQQSFTVYARTDPNLFDVSYISLSGNIATWVNDYMDARPMQVWAKDLSGSINGGQAFQVDSDPNNYNQSYPRVSGNVVVWNNWNPNNNSQGIWGKNIVTGQDFLIYQGGQGVTNSRAVISGNYVAWWTNQNGNYRIITKDISNPSNPAVLFDATSDSSQRNPYIRGNVLVCQDDRNGNLQIWGKNLKTGVVEQISTASSWEAIPALNDNGLVAWNDNRNGDWDIYAKNLPPELSDSYVAGDLVQANTDSGDIPLYVGPGDQYAVSLSDQYAVFQSTQPLGQSLGISFSLADSISTMGSTSYPSGASGVYGVSLVPEPSTMALLLAGGLFVLLRICCSRRK